MLLGATKLKRGTHGVKMMHIKINKRVTYPLEESFEAFDTVFECSHVTIRNKIKRVSVYASG